MNLLRFEHISKSFSGVEVLHDINFSIEKGQVISLLGENGAGKSTLVKILCGILTEYEGKIYLNGKPIFFKNPREAEYAGISIIHQELNLVPDLSVAENIYLGREPVTRADFIDYKAMTRNALNTLSEFDFPYSVQTHVRHLPVGWQQMVEIAKALSLNAEIIVMDEPTSALSNSEIEFLFQKIAQLRKQGKTIIYISHRMKEIFEVSDHIVILRDGYFVGQYSIDEVNSPFLIQQMIGKTIPETVRAPQIESRKSVFSMQKVDIIRNQRLLLTNIDFDLKRGEVLGIAGLLGAGRTEILKFIYGHLKARFTGTINFDEKPYFPKSPTDAIRKGIVFLSEDRKGEGIFSGLNNLTNASISVLEQLSHWVFIQNRKEKMWVTEKIKALNIRMESLQQQIDFLSGGNQQKILLARVLLLNPRLLLLDEPTRGIDVGAKQEIYQLIGQLQKAGISVIITSSEIPELLWITNRILVLSAGRQTALLNTSETNSKEILSYAFKQV